MIVQGGKEVVIVQRGREVVLLRGGCGDGCQPPKGRGVVLLLGEGDDDSTKGEGGGDSTKGEGSGDSAKGEGGGIVEGWGW